MALHQGLEGRLVVVTQEPPQEPAITHPVGRRCAGLFVEGLGELAS
jgi:hypothetical protein